MEGIFITFLGGSMVVAPVLCLPKHTNITLYISLQETQVWLFSFLKKGSFT